MRILIAEDNRVARMLLERALSEFGYTVISTCDGKEAWEALQHEDAPRLAVLDWEMPEINGDELCRRLKDIKDAPYIYIILLTGKTEKEDIIKGLESGADDFISKPFDKNELKSRLKVGVRILDYESRMIAEIQKRSELERELKDKEMEERLRQADKMVTMGTMAAGVAHDVNNPLSVAIGDVHLIKRDMPDLFKFINHFSSVSLPPDVSKEVEKLRADLDIPYITEGIDKKLSRCENAMNRIKNIVQGLKDFSRSDEGEIANTDIANEIKSSLEMIPQRYKRGIEIKTEFPPLPEVPCYGGQLGQVFMNINVNALQAMNGDGVLEIQTSSDNEYILIKIRDSGPGIPEEKLKQIFNQFYTTKPKGEGTGLGLSICSTIIQKHGGEITVVNNADKGVTFTIKLAKEGVKDKEY